MTIIGLNLKSWLAYILEKYHILFPFYNMVEIVNPSDAFKLDTWKILDAAYSHHDNVVFLNINKI